MKKTMVVLFTSIVLSACGNSPEQTSLQDAMTAKLKDDQDLKDYKLDPSEVAACVVKSITDSLPGFSGDPRRARYFEAYTRFVSVDSPGAADSAMQQYQDLFGGIKEAREAANTVTDHIMSCMGVAIAQHGDDASPRGEDAAK